MLKEADDKTLITITPEWMEQKFDEMNKLLFNGVLYKPQFSLFTKGKGSRGGTLGWFKINKDYNVIWKSDRYHGGYQAYVKDSWGDSFMLQPEEFVYYMHPLIQLNGNYNWTEKAALTTLVHEMCHYYVSRNGHWPKQAHGPEFVSVARMVSQKSNEFFTVQRLAKAEQMEQMDFTDDMKARNNAFAAKGIHFIKFEFVNPEYSKKGRTYKCAYAIPASTIAEKYISYVKSYSPDKYKRIVHCVTTDGNIKKYHTINSVGTWYYSKGETVDDVMPDVKVDFQEDIQFGGEGKTQQPWYIFRMKYKVPYENGGTKYPWAYRIAEFKNFFAVKNYVNNERDRFVYADYTETYDPKIQSHKANNLKKMASCFVSLSQNVLTDVKQSEPTVIFNNDKSMQVQQQQSPLASFLYGNGGNPHLQYQQQKAAAAAAAPQPVKRYSFIMNLIGKNGITSQFTVTNATEEEAKQQMRQRFPNWSEEVINDKFSKYAKVV